MAQAHHQCQQCQELRPDSRLERTRVFWVCKDKKRCRKRTQRLDEVQARERRERRYWKDSDLRALERAKRALS